MMVLQLVYKVHWVFNSFLIYSKPHRVWVVLFKGPSMFISLNYNEKT